MSTYQTSFKESEEKRTKFMKGKLSMWHKLTTTRDTNFKQGFWEPIEGFHVVYPERD